MDLVPKWANNNNNNNNNIKAYGSLHMSGNGRDCDPHALHDENHRPAGVKAFKASK